jgi:hypothetical protein
MQFSRLTVGLAAVAITILLAMPEGITPASAQDAGNVAIADGLTVYLGLMPAALLAEHDPGHLEREMHGGVPGGQHVYHLILAIFEQESGERVENAVVTATVSGLGHLGRASVALEPMSIEGTVTYGGFVDMSGYERYDIEARIVIPGRQAASATFSGEHFP